MTQIPPQEPFPLAAPLSVGNQPGAVTPPKSGWPTWKIVTLVVSIAVLVIVLGLALMMAMLVPALGQARKAARNVQDQASLRQVAIAMHSYAADNQEALPIHVTDLGPHGGQHGLPAHLLISSFHPGQANTHAVLTQPEPAYRYGDYVFLLAGRKLSDFKHPSKLWLAYRAAIPQARARVVLFADGHVEQIAEADFQAAMLQQNQLRQNELNLPPIDATQFDSP
ncbi:MAG: type II secretion system protein [Phycisphaeraceae bacterium]